MALGFWGLRALVCWGLGVGREGSGFGLRVGDQGSGFGLRVGPQTLQPRGAEPTRIPKASDEGAKGFLMKEPMSRHCR